MVAYVAIVKHVVWPFVAYQLSSFFKISTSPKDFS